ncbi:hypothetical protein DAPPUDRAFT_105426 [Daphnia pulex]|uniref:Alpha-1,4-N-acetylglucosaminyltransferase n=1 Tax=Daphnia pulex TaxID=6669 RepID=E9GQS0_DAPPU|nr:hypothetical protein DAPPUDRAFT_105426 [Daphnia pulex]|eukprot:EFX78164.1 hypothetical protein DAPPUDRAFT_105426 [Daphnia pulex]
MLHHYISRLVLRLFKTVNQRDWKKSLLIGYILWVACAFILTNVGIILGCHIWLAHFGSDSITNISEDGGAIRRASVRISQWRQGYLEAIDSRRIVLHETSGRGSLNVRQSCSVESAARHNPDRPIQIFMRWKTTSSDDPGNSTDAWLAVLSHYNNVEIVQIDDDILYSNNTALYNWFKMKWRTANAQQHLSHDYIRSLTLFKGGGLFLDMDKVMAIKPLTWSKWNNFFVIESKKGGMIAVEMLHLLHGHHLIDEIILNMANNKADDAATGNGILAAAIDASVNKICGSWKNRPNQCLDVRLIDEEDVILPPFDSLFWGSSSLGINSKEGYYDVMKKAILNHRAVLMKWNSMAAGQLNRNVFDSMYYLALMEEHCPFTLANAKHFPTFHSSLNNNFNQ